jgi:hypothetical protein
VTTLLQLLVGVDWLSNVAVSTPPQLSVTVKLLAGGKSAGQGTEVVTLGGQTRLGGVLSAIKID